MGTVVFRDFEWDDMKAATNLRKRGVSFEEAATVFLDLELWNHFGSEERVLEALRLLVELAKRAHPTQAA